MPSVTHAPALPSSAKKRRRDDDGGGGGGSGDVQVPLYASPKHHHHVATTADGVFYASSPQYHHPHPQNLYSALGGNGERLILANHRDSGSSAAVYNIPRKVIPLPVSKRPRTLPDADQENRPHGGSLRHHNGQPQFSHAHPEHHSTPPMSPQTRPHGHDTDARPGLVRSVTASGLLNPCHICHRKPTKKSDLDSFADCMGCGQRTCFVCIRQCQGWVVGGSPQGADGGRPPPPQHHRQEQQDHLDAEERQQQQQQDLSASFTMHDVDDDDNNNNNDVDPRTSPHRGRGHREVICSGCCVERGSEGDVVCLGCLAGMEGA